MGVSVVSFDKNVVLSSFFVFDRFRFLSRFSFRGITMVLFSVVLLMLAWASIGEGLPPLPPGVNLGVQGCVNPKNWANVICQNGVLVGCDTGNKQCWKQCASVQDAGTDTSLLIGHCYPQFQRIVPVPARLSREAEEEGEGAWACIPSWEYISCQNANDCVRKHAGFEHCKTLCNDLLALGGGSRSQNKV